MIILGAIIETDIIKGIGRLTYMQEGSNAWYQFDLLTTSGIMNFSSDVIADVAFATKFEQHHLHDFKQEYNHIRNEVSHLINAGHDHFEYHAHKVSRAYDQLTEIHQQLEAVLSKSKSKGKEEWTKILGSMAPHIIQLKNLAGYE